MNMFHIRVKTGNENIGHLYHFVHKNYETLSTDEQWAEWDKTVKELNHIYKDYGRFATRTGVYRFFDYHGFEMTMP